MANIDKARHAFGALENIDNAIADGKIDSYDILFVKDAEGKPYVGWIDKDGKKVIVNDDAEFAAIEKQMATKADAEDINTKIGELETALDDVAKAAYAHEQIKYEFTDVPAGSLVDYREDEIRVMCPANAVWGKQAVGVGGDPNAYYGTFKTYVYDDNIVGYKEHLGNQSDPEILTDLKTDQYGRRYQPTWLSLAKYDEATDTWNYRGNDSTNEKYIGWDYRIDWFDASGVMVASDSIRINLSNENCHSNIEPYYVGKMMKEVNEKIDTKIEEKIAEVESAYEVIEF